VNCKMTVDRLEQKIGGAVSGSFRIQTMAFGK
jgi:hypothetical protein